MIWLTWRQFRVQALATFAAFALLAIYLIILGTQIRHSYNTDIAHCLTNNCATLRDHFTETYGGQVSAVGILLIAVPALIGIFWGAPLVAREFEDGTHRLIWNQSVTRTHWLAVKLALVGLAGLLATGALSLLLTWSASRYDQLKGDRFAADFFDSRNVVPLGYALFAFVLGTVIGLILHRALVAMAVTLVVFAAIQLLIPGVVRSHYLPPRTTSVAVSADSLSDAAFSISPQSVNVFNYSAPGAWSLSSKSEVFDASGKPVPGLTLSHCISPGDNGPKVDGACLSKLNAHFDYTFQPAHRYWTFQWIELSIFVVLSALVAGLGFWWIRKRPS